MKPPNRFALLAPAALALLGCAGAPAPEPAPPAILGEAPPPLAPPACTEETAWNGQACAPVAPPAPAPPADCAPGTHREEGQGCVADAPPPPPPCPEGMALVEGGGPFKMGQVQRDATVGAFCLDVNLATAEDYAGCVKSGGCSTEQLKCAAAATYETEGRAAHPMVCVDFPQAVSYCTAKGKRLPTEAEWEWAARGGAEGRLYPWGNEPPKDQLCWSGLGALAGTCPVGSFPTGKSPHGILDLAGNVYEWTTSDNDAKSPLRVGRGGSWRDGIALHVRASRPGGFAVNYRCGFLGIRCALEPKSP